MDLDLFLDTPGTALEDQVDFLRGQILELQESSDKVRKRLFSEINELKKSLLSLQLDQIGKEPKHHAWDLLPRDGQLFSSSGKIISINTA